jgi:hypothetical protein
MPQVRTEDALAERAFEDASQRETDRVAGERMHGGETCKPFAR